jgi:hypothetical protein
MPAAAVPSATGDRSGTKTAATDRRCAEAATHRDARGTEAAAAKAAVEASTAVKTTAAKSARRRRAWRERGN